MQKPCTCEFLYGVMTSNTSKTQVAQALSRTEEVQIIILLYRKDGIENLRLEKYLQRFCQLILFNINDYLKINNKEII